MKLIKEKNEDAYKWPMDVGREEWVGCKPGKLYAWPFYGRLKCDLICNSISEFWNKHILEAQDKCTVTMLELIRRMFEDKALRGENIYHCMSMGG